MSAVRTITVSLGLVAAMLFAMLAAATVLFHTLGIPAWDGLAMIGCATLLAILFHWKPVTN